MTGTVYADVHGLDAKSRSTAKDLAKLLAYIYKKHPEILAMTKNNDFWLPNRQGVWLKFQNMNYFYNVPEFVGGKTGYSPDARQTFAAIFNIGKKPVAIVMLHSTNLEADTFKIIGKLKK
jgi:D-alanyl-D-alanine carboxypeptidase